MTGSATTDPTITDPSGAVHDVAVPAYFHPVVWPDLWERMQGLAAELRFVVVNPHNGVGDGTDSTYAGAVAGLVRAGVRTVGYVDTAYGERDPADVVAEAGLYRERYGIDGVFLDQASNDLAGVSTYERYLLGLRTSGVRFVVLNPGVHPHPAYVEKANVTVTFEGPFDDYVQLEEPGWVRERPASRFCHLVHGLHGPADARRARSLVARRHARTVCLTEGSGDNPWDRLPIGLAEDDVRGHGRAC